MGCLIVFEGMKAVSRPCVNGSQTLLKDSIPFKKGLATSLLVTANLNDNTEWIVEGSLKLNRTTWVH